MPIVCLNAMSLSSKMESESISTNDINLKGKESPTILCLLFNNFRELLRLLYTKKQTKTSTKWYVCYRNLTKSEKMHEKLSQIWLYRRLSLSRSAPHHVCDRDTLLLGPLNHQLLYKWERHVSFPEAPQNRQLSRMLSSTRIEHQQHKISQHASRRKNSRGSFEWLLHIPATNSDKQTYIRRGHKFSCNSSKDNSSVKPKSLNFSRLFPKHCLPIIPLQRLCRARETSQKKKVAS